MDKIEELEKYKKLLDDRAITEDEFRLMKQKILGLKTDDFYYQRCVFVFSGVLYFPAGSR